MKLPELMRRVYGPAVCACMALFSGVAVSSQSVIATIPAQEGSEGLPMSIAVDPIAQMVYVAGDGVEVVDQKTNLPVTTINIGQNQLSSIAINPVSRRLYVTDFFDGTYIVSLATDTVVGYQAIPGAYTSTYNPSSDMVYTLDNLGTIWVNNGATGALVKTINVSVNGGAPGFTLSVSPLSNLIYVPVAVTTPGGLEVVNPTSGTVKTVQLQGSSPYFAGIDTAHNMIYISDQAGGMDVVNSTTNKDVAFVTGIPIQPMALSIDPTTRLVYLSNANSTVEVIDGKTNTLTSTVIPVGTNPDFSAIDLVHGLLYVGNTAEFQPGTQSVSVISLR